MFFKLNEMDDGYFLLFLFGITAVSFFSLILISYLIFYFVFQNQDNEKPENYLPDKLKINLENYCNLQNFKKFNNKLSNTEKITYLLSTCYCKFNKPILIPIELSSTNVTTESLLIRDRGIESFYFEDYYDQINNLFNKLQNMEENEVNERTALLNSSNNNNNNLEEDFKNNKILNLLKKLNYKSIIPKTTPFIIEDLVEINFKSINLKDLCYSTVLNLPIPTVNRKNDIIYFETKLLEFNMLTTLISIGLVTDPKYPNFQLPGYLPYSFSVESNGNLRMTKKNDKDEVEENDDVNIVLPQLTEGDVIGLGFRSISGTIFLTHNGKLIYEIIKRFKFQLYPCIGIKQLTNDFENNKCKINVNFGQMGFVYIEANVKKLGFCENKNEGLIGAPPIYNKTNQTNEVLLDKGEEIPPDYPTDENSFFGPIVGSSNNNNNNDNNNEVDREKLDEQVVLNDKDSNSTPNSEPPSYNSEKKDNMNDQEYEGMVSVEDNLESNEPVTKSVTVDVSDDTNNNTNINNINNTDSNNTKGKKKNKSKVKGKGKKKNKKNKTLF